MRLALAACLTLGGLATAASAQDVLTGQTLFQGFCAACHGLEAQGDGPMREILKIPPPDLTVLATGNGGVFPMEHVVRTIDGRTVLQSHGGPMPLFGGILEGDAAVIDSADGTPIITKAPVIEIARWLDAIQR